MLVYRRNALTVFGDKHRRIKERAQVPVTGFDISTRSDPLSRRGVRYHGRVSVGSFGEVI